MSWKTDIRDMLQAAVPGVKVSPLVNSRKEYPAVVYRFRNGQGQLLYGNYKGLPICELDVHVFAKKYSEMTSKADAIEAAFHGFRGMAGSTGFQSEVVNRFESFLDDGELLQGILQIRIALSN